MPALVTEKEYSDVPYGSVGPMRMVNMRLNAELMESVTAFCSCHNITLKAFLELVILMGLASDDAARLAREHSKRLRERQRLRRRHMDRLYKNKHLL